mmetsp:Transcript_10463/g.29926  ORF Transcript_10463/g.29926 Transcript_10463/m.29926 type:complete len:214 (+) Transcript_10463:306-947(+)
MYLLSVHGHRGQGPGERPRRLLPRDDSALRAAPRGCGRHYQRDSRRNPCLHRGGSRVPIRVRGLRSTRSRWKNQVWRNQAQKEEKCTSHLGRCLVTWCSCRGRHRRPRRPRRGVGARSSNVVGSKDSGGRWKGPDPVETRRGERLANAQVEGRSGGNGTRGDVRSVHELVVCAPDEGVDGDGWEDRGRRGRGRTVVGSERGVHASRRVSEEAQ